MLQRIPLLTPKSRPITIRCHDCGKEAPALLHPDGEALPPGWVGARVRFKQLYTCPICGEKRRKWVQDNIIRRNQHEKEVC